MGDNSLASVFKLINKRVEDWQENNSSRDNKAPLEGAAIVAAAPATAEDFAG
jgi:hypothetical protein